MRCCTSPERNAPAAARALWIVTLALLLVQPQASAQGADAGFEIRAMHTRLVDGVYLLDADIDFDFSDESLEALHSGVPLTVSIEMQVLRERPLVDERIAAVSALYELHVHALSGQYVVTALGTGSTRTFRSYPEATADLGRLRDFPLFDAALLDADESYRLRIRAVLDIEALPSPMRLIAYFDALWRLSSTWRSWELPQ